MSRVCARPSRRAGRRRPAWCSGTWETATCTSSSASASSGPETRHAVEEIVYRPLGPIGGSISAEHGIGLQKRAFLPLSRSATEIALMRTLKQALDPKGILNPGKIFEAA